MARPSKAPGGRALRTLLGRSVELASVDGIMRSYPHWGHMRRLFSLAALEVHHVVKRAQGGSDFDLDQLIALCPPCHAQTDAPYTPGRLVITPLGDGRFTVEVIRGVDKWAIRA